MPPTCTPSSLFFIRHALTPDRGAYRYLNLVHVNASHSCVTNVGVAALGAACSALRHVELSWCIGVDDVGVQALVAGCPELQHALLKHTSVGDDTLVALGALCVLLTHVDVSNTKVSRSGVDALRQRRAELTECELVVDGGVCSTAVLYVEGEHLYDYDIEHEYMSHHPPNGSV